jgi:hypothetical protein
MNIKTFIAAAVIALTAACAQEAPEAPPAGADEAPREQGPRAPLSK